MNITYDFIPLIPGIDLTTRQLPMMIADSGVPGPTVWLTGAIHGDEVTGTAIIQSIFRRLKREDLLCGKLFAIPILNPTGFETITRREALTDSDLNRSFGGSAQSGTAGIMAGKILSAVTSTKPDYVIDLHTDSTHSIAYTLVDIPKTIKNEQTLKKSITIAQTLGFPWALDTETSAGYPVEECFTGRLLTEGIPAVTIEIGWPYIIVDERRQKGVSAVWGFLQALGMIKGEKILSSDVPHDVSTFAERITTKTTGIVEYEVQPGADVTQGQLLGIVRNVFGEPIEQIMSPVNGKLFSHEDQSVTFPGLVLFTLVVPSDYRSVVTLATKPVPFSDDAPERTG
jgi:uncharacterized protein